jgi:hypothetical protein
MLVPSRNWSVAGVPLVVTSSPTATTAKFRAGAAMPLTSTVSALITRAIGVAPKTPTETVRDNTIVLDNEEMPMEPIIGGCPFGVKTYKQ